MHNLDPKVLFTDLLDSPAPPLPTQGDVLTNARRRLRRRRSARLAGAAGFLAVVMAGAGTIASGASPFGAGEVAGRPGDSAPAPLPPASWSPPDGHVACSAERSTTSDLSVIPWPAGRTPVEACRKHWPLLYKIRPKTLYACVFRGPADEAGAVFVIPGKGYATAADACGSIHLYVAPDNIAPNPAGNLNTDPEPTPERT